MTEVQHGCSHLSFQRIFSGWARLELRPATFELSLRLLRPCTLHRPGSGQPSTPKDHQAAEMWDLTLRGTWAYGATSCMAKPGHSVSVVLPIQSVWRVCAHTCH